MDLKENAASSPKYADVRMLLFSGVLTHKAQSRTNDHAMCRGAIIIVASYPHNTPFLEPFFWRSLVIL